LKADLLTLCWLLVLMLSIFFLASNLLLAPILRLIRTATGNRKNLILSPVHSVSIVIPAYNEEQSIGKKIETLCSALQRIDMDVEVIIGSDGSTDRTVEVAALQLQEMNDPRWRLVEFVNEGKCKTLNKLVGMARGTVIISTDADIPLPADSIERAVQAFQSNSRIGCLSCIPCFEAQDIGSQKSYWSIEEQIRRAESELGKLIVVTGMFYAYRKELFTEIPDGVMADDLWIPMNVLLKGFDSVQVDGLLVPYEKTDEETEIFRRKRVIVGGMDVVRRLWLPLIKYPSLLGLVVFHKVTRWALPVWIVMLISSTVGLRSWLIYIYLVGVLSLFCILGKKKFSALVYAVFSPVIAVRDIIRSKDFARWEHTRKH